LEHGKTVFNEIMWELYHKWPVEGPASQVGPRLTWPLPWSEVASLLKEIGLNDNVVEALR